MKYGNRRKKFDKLGPISHFSKKKFSTSLNQFLCKDIYRKDNDNIRSNRSKLTQTLNIVGKKGVNMRILLTMQQELAAT